MTESILRWIEQCAGKIEPERVLEVGSYNVNGSPRGIFKKIATEYIGVDMQAGPSVDIVASSHQLPFTEGFNIIICCEMLEHDDDPLRSIAEIKRLLLPNGYLIVTSPANGFGLHRYPRDYWRLMPDVYEDIIFKDMQIISKITTHDPCNCYFGQKK